MGKPTLLITFWLANAPQEYIGYKDVKFTSYQVKLILGLNESVLYFKVLEHRPSLENMVWIGSGQVQTLSQCKKKKNIKKNTED